MVSTCSPPSKRPAAAAGAASSAPSPSRAEQTTASINAQISSAIPSTVPTSAADLPSLPTLDHAPPARAARSHLVLFALVSAAVLLGWLVGFDLLQLSGPHPWSALAAWLAAFAAVLLAALHWIGIARIDFWAMLNGYWWLSVPVVVAAMAAVTVMQERATGLHEVE